MICPKIEEMNEERKAKRQKELIESALVDLDYCETSSFGKGCLYLSSCSVYKRGKNESNNNDIID